jgi:hypothetical protein
MLAKQPTPFDTQPGQSADPASAPHHDNADLPIGVVMEITGGGSMVAFDLDRLHECARDGDPTIALSGQVGSQIRIRHGDRWLLASVRDQKQGAARARAFWRSSTFWARGRKRS